MTDTASPTEPFSDDALRAVLQDPTSPAGIYRRAEILLTLPTVEDRRVASRHARIAGNMVGGRPSDQLRSAAAYVRARGAAAVSAADDQLCAENRGPRS